jgi:DNA-binding beta-propeller fold protein YncE
MATVDLAAGIVIDSVPVGNDPFGIAVAPDDSRVYVSIFGRPRGSGGALVVVDVVADLVTAVIPLGGYAGPVAISPNGPTIFVAASTPLAYVIDAINLADNSISEQLTLLGGPTNDLKFITARPVVSYEAENPGNILSGKTSVVSCPICSGGSAVAAVAEPGSGRTGGALTFTNVAGIAAAQADLSIYYQHSAREPITASVNINGVNTVVNFPPVQAGSPPSRIVLAVPGQTVGTVRITGVQGTSSSSLTIDRLTVQ